MGYVVAIIGGSGTGESTMLSFVNFLETPTSGGIVLNDGEVAVRPDGSPANRRQIERIRTRLGMAFQAFNL